MTAEALELEIDTGMHAMETLLTAQMDAAMELFMAWSYRNAFTVGDWGGVVLVSTDTLRADRQKPTELTWLISRLCQSQPAHEGLDFPRGQYVAEQLPEGEQTVDQSIDALRLKVEQVRQITPTRLADLFPNAKRSLCTVLCLLCCPVLIHQKRLLLQTLQKATAKSQHDLAKARALSEELAFFRQTSQAYSRKLSFDFTVSYRVEGRCADGRASHPFTSSRPPARNPDQARQLPHQPPRTPPGTPSSVLSSYRTATTEHRPGRGRPVPVGSGGVHQPRRGARGRCSRWRGRREGDDA